MFQGRNVTLPPGRRRGKARGAGKMGAGHPQIPFIKPMTISARNRDWESDF